MSPLRGFLPPRFRAAIHPYRKRLVQAHTSEGQRIAKILEDAGINFGLSHLWVCQVG